MNATPLPALCLIASPSKRAAVLELAVEAERRGFAGLGCPGLGGGLALCSSLAHVTTSIPFFTSIQPMYLSVPAEVTATASHLHEVSGGRFRLGLGVSHTSMLDGLGVASGKPLADMRGYVADLHSCENKSGPLPPILLAALRDRMLDLAVEIADGAIWANASRSHAPTQLARIPADRLAAMQLWNMVPTAIDVDRDAARALHRRTVSRYVILPNYRNYWKSAGYEDEMVAVETAMDAGDHDAVVAAMSNRFLDDCTISGSPSEVRDQLAQWAATGVTPIAVMSSTTGGQAKAIRELFELYNDRSSE